MQFNSKSIRPFIGAKDYETSRSFYRSLGFEEVTLGSDMCLFKTGDTAFYLQRAYVKDWVDNTMIFMEVEDANQCYSSLAALNLPAAFPGVRLTPVQHNDWGSECFLHDPSGILWHFGHFNKP